MNLCIDIGNTASKVAVFDKNKMVFYKRFNRLPFSSLQKLIKEYGCKNGIISSTRKKNDSLLKKLRKELHLVDLDHETKLPFKNTYHTPETLGKDRLAAVAGAVKMHPKKACLIADLGTCNTYDYVTADKEYLGGNIAPGMQMRLEAMHDYTDKLPRAEAVLNDNLMGLSTTEALQNGAIKGIILEIEGYIRSSKAKNSLINVILTGGDAIFFAKHFKKRIFVEPNLVLIGLNHILKYNY